MLFHEIYGAYYHTVSAILQDALRKHLTKARMREYIAEQAFGESMMTIPERLLGETWRLLHKDYTTPLRNEPNTPMTTLEKRWLKTMLLDPRIQLFDPDSSGLEDVEPLFVPEDLVYHDRYTDGDPYRDPDYISHFRIIVRSLREEKNLRISFRSRLGMLRTVEVTPHLLEYSEKDDRFRLIAADEHWRYAINLSRIGQCEMTPSGDYYPYIPAEKTSVTFELEDARKALERVLLNFSHLEKETKRLDESHYLVTLYYDRADENEMVIRILSFGPFIRVTKPESFITLLQNRIQKQKNLAAFPKNTSDAVR